MVGHSFPRFLETPAPGGTVGKVTDTMLACKLQDRKCPQFNRAYSVTSAQPQVALSSTERALHRALASEARIRAGLRRDTKIDLQFTVRGKRGAGRTRETILDRVRFWRKQHTASIERSRALLASLGGVA